jgi:hypothetical protein
MFCFILLCGAGVWTQDLMSIRQVLYELRHALSPKALLLLFWVYYSWNSGICPGCISCLPLAHLQPLWIGFKCRIKCYLRFYCSYFLCMCMYLGTAYFCALFQLMLSSLKLLYNRVTWKTIVDEKSIILFKNNYEQ